jgi:hypothetical protein
MSIPSTITDALESLEAQVTAAQPLVNASQATRTALKLNAAALVDSIQETLTETSLLDTWAATADVKTIVSGVLSVVDASNDQQTLSLWRGVTGRVVSNLDMLP